MQYYIERLFIKGKNRCAVVYSATDLIYSMYNAPKRKCPILWSSIAIYAHKKFGLLQSFSLSLSRHLFRAGFLGALTLGAVFTAVNCTVETGRCCGQKRLVGS